ncbi:MAG: tRNA (N6-isopentenyl adenosine(37)-C2)-methylthiotransferase MiaB [Treponema sp.]|nr:tRNA (N6-isopentenyl adenosine(37)-C2)-methylthiotransferase MiaB [Treponema sp.]
MTYFFETYGCQMNIAESAAIEQLLIARKWTKAEDAELADLVIINTCSVRATAENRIFGRLGWYSGLKAVRSCDKNAKGKFLEKAVDYVKDGPKPLTLVVTGCMAERLLDSLKKDYPFIDYVVGTYAKHHFGEILDAMEAHTTTEQLNDTELYKFASLSYEPGAFTAFVPIMHGCNNFCTYCIVPYVRGRECSRPVDEILNEIDVLSSYGVREITLLGQNVNSYNGNLTGSVNVNEENHNETNTNQDDSKTVNFAGLLQIIAAHLKETKSPIEWVRFMSSHPKDLSEEVVKIIAQEEVLCHHIHLPVQHGSTEVLRRMNRRYTREEYIQRIEMIRKQIPDVSLTTDLMMGFPGETEEDVEATLDLMKEIRYENAFMYYYNPREGTPATKMEGQLSDKVKKDRLQKIIDLQLKITAEEMEKRVGKTVKVLAEGVSRDNAEELLGKTEQDEKVAFKASKSLIGKFCQVKIESLSGNTFRGQLV